MMIKMGKGLWIGDNVGFEIYQGNTEMVESEHPPTKIRPKTAKST